MITSLKQLAGAVLGTVFAAALLIGLAAPARAGQAVAGSAAADSAPALGAERVAAFSKDVETVLAQSGARVAIIARTGRPPETLPDGMRYTHVAFAVYSMISLEDGRSEPGYTIWNLYQNADDPGRSHLAQDHPFDFFASVPVLRAGVLVPDEVLQARLLRLIGSDRYRALHNPRYSVIANPFNNQRQNCTEFTLNVLQAAIYGRHDMPYLKRSLQEHFSPTPVEINPLRLLAGAALVREVSLSDHAGPPATATFGSITRYLEENDLERSVVHLSEAVSRS